MIIMGVVFLISSIAGKFMGIHLGPLLGLSGAGIGQGLVYQFLTYPFITSSFMGVIFNALILWFMGSDLENNWGRKFYLQFFAVIALTSGPIFIILSLIFPSLGGSALMGMSGFAYAVLLAYGIIYPDRQMLFMMIFPVKAKYFCMLIVGILLYMGIFSPAGAGSLAHLSAIFTGFIFLRYKSWKKQGGSISQIKKEAQRQKMKKKLYIVKDGDKKDKDDKPDPKNPKFWQ